MISAAYVAGLADSDGSFSITIRHKARKNPSYVACFQIGWSRTDKAIETFNLLKDKYGGAVYLQTPKETGFGKPDMVKYFCQGVHLDNLIKDCLPYLRLKRRNARLIMFLRAVTKVGIYGHGRPKPENLKIFQHGLYLKAKEANTKNSGDRRKHVQSP